MEYKPLISVVVPTYNRKEFLGRTIKSILGQTYSNFELIVVDNCSNYDFFEYIESFQDARIKPFQNANHGIIATNRNFGINYAQGGFVAFCDDDDWWYPNKLEACLPYLKDYDVIYHGLEVSSAKETKEILPGRQVAIDNVFIDLYINRNAIPNSSVIVRKSILIAVNGISEDKNLISVEDYDCWLRISQISNKFKHIAKNLGSYYVGEGNISVNGKYRINTHKYLFRKYNKQLSFRYKVKALISQNIQIAEWYCKMGRMGIGFWFYFKALRPWKIKESYRVVIK